MINSALEAFGLGPEIRKFIQIINKDIWCTTMNNAKWTEWFQIHQGCRQGSPSSAIIFLIIAEVLGIKIRNNRKIKGLKMYHETLMTEQYADDLWIVLSPEAESINEMLDELIRFQQFSGLHVNFEKTKAFKLGPCRKQDFQFITKKVISWTEDPVKILGFWIHPDQQKMYELNYELSLKKAESTLKLWERRKLTLMGRICIINTLIASLFSHKLMTLPHPPEKFFIEFKRITLAFLWEGKAHKIRYEKLIQNYNKGGLKLIDLEAKAYALRAKWPLYFKDRQENWLYGVLKLDHRIWQFNIEVKDVARICESLRGHQYFETNLVSLE